MNAPRCLAGSQTSVFRASRAHVNTLIAASGDTITARARWLVRNNGYATNAVESFASNVVGDGIKPSSSITDAALKEQLQALWLAWTDDADAEGLTDFYGLQRRAAREVFLSGEVFIRIRPRRAEDGLTVPLQLQMLPAEMLPLDMNRTLPGPGLIRHRPACAPPADRGPRQPMARRDRCLSQRRDGWLYASEHLRNTGAHRRVGGGFLCGAGVALRSRQCTGG